MAVYLGVRLSSSSFDRYKIEEINFDKRIDFLRDEAAKKTQLPRTSLELIYCGRILEDDLTLSQCGIKPGVMVHVFKKKVPLRTKTSKTITDAEIKHIVEQFTSYPSSSNSRIAFFRMGRPEILENIIKSTPNLLNDPVALAIIRDPILLLSLSEVDVVKKIAELHPALIEACPHIFAAVQEQAANMNSNQSGSSSGYSYTLEALLNDEDSDSSGSDTAQPSTSTSSRRRQRPSTITAHQLRTALAFANNTQLSQRTPVSSPGRPFYFLEEAHTSRTDLANTNNVITPSMFNNALSRALSTTLTPQNSAATNTGGNTPSAQPGSADQVTDPRTLVRSMAPQMQRMREMGLTNEGINLQALMISNGDVQAAINLVFSGAMGNN